MSTFKVKPDKVRQYYDIKTLDDCHRKVVDKFKKKKDLLPKKRAKLQHLESKLLELEKRDKGNFTNDDISSRAELKSSVQNLKNDIYDTENNVNELEYYSKTDDVLMDYYDIVRQDTVTTKTDPDLLADNIKNKDVVKDKQPLNILDKLNLISKKRGKIAKKTCRKQKFTDVNSKKNSSNTNIFSYLNIETKDEEKDTDNPNNSNSNKNKNKAELFNQYTMITDSSSYFNKKKYSYDDISKCIDCGAQRTLFRSEGMFVCEPCGTFDIIIIESETANYNDDNSGMISGMNCGDKNCSYKRKNHMSEWLSQIQARESTEIPDEVYDLVYEELNKQQFYDMKKLTLKYMKEILKKINKATYYEHASYIICRLSGRTAPSISRESEAKLKHMFEQIQIPFERHCPPDRLNFLSYSYILHKFCLLLELDEFVKYFPLLKNPDKLRAQDNIWERICRDLQWEYHPSI